MSYHSIEKGGISKPIILSNRQIRSFWNHVDKSTEHWLWTGTLTEDGYGDFDTSDRRHGIKRCHYQAHRVAWFLENGPISEGSVIIHKCEYRRCVLHIKSGTVKENIHDSIKAGTFMAGGRLVIQLDKILGDDYETSSLD